MSMKEAALQTPLIEILWPGKSLSRSFTLIFGTSLLLAASARIAFHLPFSPVPITFQTLVVLLAGAVLGSRSGALSVLVYLGQGAAGLPFFAKGGAGLAYLRGVSGGYLVGFVFAAFVAGLIVERGFGRRISTAIVAMLIGNVLIYISGLFWLKTVLNITISKAMSLGLYSFIPGDLYKIGIASVLLPVAWNFFGKSEN